MYFVKKIKRTLQLCILFKVIYLCSRFRILTLIDFNQKTLHLICCETKTRQCGMEVQSIQGFLKQIVFVEIVIIIHTYCRIQCKKTSLTNLCKLFVKQFLRKLSHSSGKLFVFFANKALVPLHNIDSVRNFV